MALVEDGTLLGPRQLDMGDSGSMNREELPSDVKAAVEWLAMDLPNIVTELGTSLTGLRHELSSLTRQVEEMERANDALKSSVAMVRQRLGLT